MQLRHATKLLKGRFLIKKSRTNSKVLSSDDVQPEMSFVRGNQVRCCKYTIAVICGFSSSNKNLEPKVDISKVNAWRPFLRAEEY
jgi:hypothetical protein